MIKGDSSFICYYAYRDKSQSRYYFHNPISNELTWEFPLSAKVIDGITLQPFAENKSNTVKLSKSFDGIETLKEQFSCSFPFYSSKKSILNINSHESQSNIPQLKKRLIAKKSDLSQLLINPPSGLASSHQDEPYLPPRMNDDSTLTDMTKFANDNFRIYHEKRIKKNIISPNDLISADSYPNCIPLLRTTDAKKTQEAVSLYHKICSYTNEATSLISSIIHDIQANGLVDEAYAQVLKQTNNNKSVEATNRAWDLLLALCTLLLPSSHIRPIVRTVTSQVSRCQDKRIAIHAQLAYIRFLGLEVLGNDSPPRSDAWIEKIPIFLSCEGKKMPIFRGVTIYEQMWFQRHSYPFCPFPIFLHLCCKYLIIKGALTIENIFSSPGNKKEIEASVTRIEEGDDVESVLEVSDVRNLSSMFKMWFREMAEPIVPTSLFPKLKKCLEVNDFLPLMNELPKVCREAIGYLIGFLKEVAKNYDKTKLGVTQLGTIFGPCLIRIEVSTPDDFKLVSDISKGFMEQLMTDWDTTNSYPIKEIYLEGAI